MTIQITLNEETIIMIEGITFLKYEDDSLELAGDIKLPAKRNYENVTNLEVKKL